jgi:hypothetical protein
MHYSEFSMLFHSNDENQRKISQSELLERAKISEQIKKEKIQQQLLL